MIIYLINDNLDQWSPLVSESICIKLFQDIHW
jgi:hypothetical protein